MILGIFARTFSRPTLGATLEAVTAHGLHHIQFNLASAGLPTLPPAVDDSVLRQIRHECGTRGIRIVALSGTFNPIHPEMRLREEGLRRFPILADIACRLGVPLITLSTGTRDPSDLWRWHPGNDTTETWRELTASLEVMLAAVAGRPVCVGFEPEAGNVVCNAARARRLLDEMSCDQLKVVIDPANLLPPGTLDRQHEILDEAIVRLGDDIVLAHAKELGPGMHPDGRGPGRGVIDWDHFLGGLRRAGFAGAVVMHGLEEAEVGPAAAFLRHRMV